MKTTKITAKQLADVVNKVSTPMVSEIEWNGLKIQIKNRLTLDESDDFCLLLTAIQFIGDDGSYRPTLRDFGVRSNIIKFYTNVELPEDVNDTYNLLYGNDLVETVRRYVDQVQLSSLLKSTEALVKHMATSEAEAIISEFKKLADRMNELTSVIEGTFSTISKEDIEGVAKAFSEGQFDVEKLVSAVLSHTEEDKEAEVVSKDN